MMKPIMFNFSQKTGWQLGDKALLLSTCILTGFLFMRLTDARDHLAALQANATQHTKAPSRSAFDSATIDAFSQAEMIQQALNVPWLSMLTAIEKTKQNNPTIALLTIVPSRAKSEVRITAEAKSFDEVTQFLDDLALQPTFSNAVLVNQHLEESDGNIKTVFELRLGWRL